MSFHVDGDKTPTFYPGRVVAVSKDLKFSVRFKDNDELQYSFDEIVLGLTLAHSNNIIQ